MWNIDRIFFFFFNIVEHDLIGVNSQSIGIFYHS